VGCPTYNWVPIHLPEQEIPVQAYTLRRRADAPIAIVFTVLADASGWSGWTRISETTLEQEGDPAPDGVGAIRHFRTGPIRSREQVTGYEPPADGRARFAYQLLSGLPVKDYQAEVVLTADGDATDIGWSADFTPGPRGTGRLTAGFLRTMVAQIANGLVAEAERRHGA
jgi:hypothetical protein